jgi:hypothetical protein
MRLNYQRSSSFGSYFASLCQQEVTARGLSKRSQPSQQNASQQEVKQEVNGDISILVVKIYTIDMLNADTLLIAIRTDYKRSSLVNNLRVLHTTGEVLAVGKSGKLRKPTVEDGRGFVVAKVKGPKY